MGTDGAGESERWWRLTTDDRKLFAVAAALLGVLAAVDQLAGIAMQAPGPAFAIAVVTLALGFPLLVGIARLYANRRRRIPMPLLPGVAALAAAVVAGAGLSYALTRTTAPGVKATLTSPPSSMSIAALPLHTEITDNRLGTPVFKDPQGTAVGSVSDRIPFNTKVQVPCWTESLAGMASVTRLYLVESAPWIGDYAPADTFANGDPVGTPGGTAIDPAVPHCPAS